MKTKGKAQAAPVIRDYEDVKEKLKTCAINETFATLRTFQSQVHVTAIKLERAFKTRKTSLTEITVTRTA